MNEKMKLLGIDESFMNRYLNEGFSGGEKKRAEILQLAMLKPKFAVLDETDSGLDIDALRVVAEGVSKIASDDLGVLVITHYQRILKYIRPTYVHVLYEGRNHRVGRAGALPKARGEGIRLAERTSRLRRLTKNSDHRRPDVGFNRRRGSSQPVTRMSYLAWRRGKRSGLSKMVVAVAVIAVVAIAGAVGVFLTAKPSSPNTSTSTSSSSSSTSTRLTTTSTAIPPGSIIIVPANYNFSVSPHGCRYFNFTDDSYYANFTGSFTATPSITMYLLNDTSFSLAQASGSAIVQYTFATAGNFNVTLALSAFKWDVSIPQNPYHLGFCHWTAIPDAVMTNSTSISISWP